MTTLDNQMSKNVIDAMNTSDNPRIDKEEETIKYSHSSRLRPVKRIENTAGVSAKSCEIILVGIFSKYKKKER